MRNSKAGKTASRTARTLAVLACATAVFAAALTPLQAFAHGGQIEVNEGGPPGAG